MRVYFDGVLGDAVEGLDVHIGQRLRVRRGPHPVETFVVESVGDGELRLRSGRAQLDLPTRVEASLWG